MHEHPALLNLTKILDASDVWAKFVATFAECESTGLHVLIQFSPADLLHQVVGLVVLALHFDNGQLTSANFLLNA